MTANRIFAIVFTLVLFFLSISTVALAVLDGNFTELPSMLWEENFFAEAKAAIDKAIGIVRVKDVYILHNSMLANSKPNLRVLHPLPRVNEIAYDVDDNPKAYYFQQAKNGLFARQAIICKVLGIDVE